MELNPLSEDQEQCYSVGTGTKSGSTQGLPKNRSYPNSEDEAEASMGKTQGRKHSSKQKHKYASDKKAADIVSP